LANYGNFGEIWKSEIFRKKMDSDEEFFSGEEFETPQSSPIKENIFDAKCPAG